MTDVNSKKIQFYINHFVTDLNHGKMEDQLGDAFEAYCTDIFSASEILNSLRCDYPLENDYENFDLSIVERLISLCDIPFQQIISIEAIRNIPRLISGGSPKTDVLIIINTENDKYNIPISIKQTSRPIVSIAEFTVDQIVNGVGITDSRLICLMNKHQLDGSAINFTEEEKKDLKDRLLPYRQAFVRWVFIGESEPNESIQSPDYLIKFNIEPYTGESILVNSIDISPIEVYITNKIGGRAGFGTGLSWTYATGSKGKRIQFKG